MMLQRYKEILGENFIGPDELLSIHKRMHIKDPFKCGVRIPSVPFRAEFIAKHKKEFILILGTPTDWVGKKLTINRMRSTFGAEPKRREPCFYNQDWYTAERFANTSALRFKWYLLRKTVKKTTRAIQPEIIARGLAHTEQFPSAILVTYVFFAYYLVSGGKLLFTHNFVWCSDKDSNGDRIYVGRYLDPKELSKNGFNIHRHLTIQKLHGLAPEYRL